MSTNCLKTMYKASVNNDALEEFGTIKVFAKNTEGEKKTIDGIGASAEYPIVLSVENGEFFNPNNPSGSYGNEVTVTAKRGILITVGAGGGIIRIKPKYDLQYMVFDKNMGFIADNYTFNLADYEYCTKLTRLSNDRDVVGDIKSLGKCIDLNRISFKSGKVTGDIKDLVGLWIDNGRASSGSIASFNIKKVSSSLFSTSDIKISLNGKELPSFYNGSDTPLTWESRTKIYILDSYQSYKYCYCTGYTDGEIAEKTASGGDWEGYIPVKY